MFTRWSAHLGCCSLVVLLSACGGSGGTVDPGDGAAGNGDDDGVIIVVSPIDTGPPLSPFLAPTEQQALFFRTALPNELDVVKNIYNDGGRTPFANLPAGGAIAYSGFMEVLFASDPNANITSPATLSVDMQTGITTGGASEFLGFVYNSATDTTELALYDGGVEFLNATVTSDRNNNANIDLAIEGTFDNGVQEFTLLGNIDGPVYGPAASGIFASGSYFGIGQEITLTADDTPVYGTATLWAVAD